jgi:CRP-like cAMP-binding protein
MNNMTGVSEIKKSLSQVHPFSEEQLSLFTDKLIYRKLKKKDFILKENQLSDGITFILSGSFRFFKKMNHGELTIKFFIENNWIAELSRVRARMK